MKSNTSLFLTTGRCQILRFAFCSGALFPLITTSCKAPEKVPVAVKSAPAWERKIVATDIPADSSAATQDLRRQMNQYNSEGWRVLSSVTVTNAAGVRQRKWVLERGEK